MKMSLVSVACGVLGSSISLAANLVVPNGTTTNFTGTLNAPDTASVAGKLNVNGGTFAPASLSINGLGSPNGDVNFNAGSISPDAITVTSFSHLNVNATATTKSIDNSAVTTVSSSFTVQNAGSGTFTNSGNLYISTGGSITADSYVGSGGGSSIGGKGSLTADSISPTGALIPGDDENGIGTGTLSLASTSTVPFGDTTYIVDFFDNGGSFISDQILVNGSITLGGSSTLIVNPVSDPLGNLIDGQQFVIIDSTAALLSGDTLANIDEPNYTVDDGVDIIGGFTVGYNEAAGQVYLTYHALPEPTALAGVGLIGLGLLRRHRSTR